MFPVSNATAKNWKRLELTEEELSVKLSKRANKLSSSQNIIPTEYYNGKVSFDVEQILDLYKTVSQKEIIYNVALNLLAQHKLIKIDNHKITAENVFIDRILKDFSQTLQPQIINYTLPHNSTDLLGFIYQATLKEGYKNRYGSYYTPPLIIETIKQKITTENKTILDPCCGTGSFLLSYYGKNAEQLYGVDVDETACFIAKINLIIKYKHIKFSPRIYCADFLTLNESLDNRVPELETKFDVIATNPPWGAKTGHKLEIKESFSNFIIKSKRFLAEHGEMLFILPISILNVKAHTHIRKFILDHFDIESIDELGRPFSGVFTDVVALKLRPKSGCPSVFATTPNYNFLKVDDKEQALLEKLDKKGDYTLEQSQWALGIVTGNNEKYLNSTGLGEPIYTGKEVSPFVLKEAKKYMVYDRLKLQQVAKAELYRANEKLIYKFISSKLVFAYNNRQSLTLNSANILIPKIEGYSIKTVAAFLNSNLFAFYYKKRFNEIKILKNSLLQLPFPKINKEEDLKITTLVDDFMVTQDKDLIDVMNNSIYNIFSLTELEINIIRQGL
jgi:16S rRNA G966 N2-methylase RsmD